MIIDFAQWLIDTIGKLGPLAVAIAVFTVNKRQIIWSNRVTVRAASLEDQKFRLALLERRAVVLRHLQEAQVQFAPNAKGVDTIGPLLDALRECRMVFEDEERSMVNGCLELIMEYQAKFGFRFDRIGESELSLAMAHYQKCLAVINDVMIRLGEAARVRQVLPLTM